MPHLQRLQSLGSQTQASDNSEKGCSAQKSAPVVGVTAALVLGEGEGLTGTPDPLNCSDVVKGESL